MSKLARVLAVGALLTAMSLGSTAHAQDGDAQSQQAGITQSDPSPTPPPGETPTPPPGETPPPPPGEAPPPPPPPSPPPPVLRPITVKVSPQAGGPGTTVNISADVSGCTQPKSAKGTFGSAARPLIGQAVSGGQFTAQYLVTKDDPVGLGHFRVVCDNAAPGLATFQVRSAPPVSVSVALSQRAGRPGTTVRITAEVGQCRYHYAYFYDSKADGVTIAGGAKPIKPLQVTAAGRLTASYTITNKDATGPARFSVGCGYADGTARFAEASFRVRAANGGGPGGGDPVNDPNKPTQHPKRIDTGLGGTADRGLDPMLLLPAAGLVLIALAAGLRLRQTTTRRRS